MGLLHQWSALKNILIYLKIDQRSLVRQVFRNEQRYYELLVEKSVINLSLFPYHLADIITKGLRVTPFNYYVDVLCYLLKHDRSYDTLPNFTAADCTYTFFSRYKSFLWVHIAFVKEYGGGEI